MFVHFRPFILSGPLNKTLRTKMSLMELLITAKLVAVVVQPLSHVRLFATPWAVAHQASLSMGFPRQEYLSELPFPSSWDLPNPGVKPRSPALQADSLPLSYLRSSMWPGASLYLSLYY